MATSTWITRGEIRTDCSEGVAPLGLDVNGAGASPPKFCLGVKTRSSSSKALAVLACCSTTITFATGLDWGMDCSLTEIGELEPSDWAFAVSWAFLGVKTKSSKPSSSGGEVRCSVEPIKGGGVFPSLLSRPLGSVWFG